MKITKVLFVGLIFGLGIFATAQEKPFEVSVTGEGNPVLLFPGFTCTGDVWEDTVKELSKNYECHVFTFAGFGEVAPVPLPWLPKIKEGLKEYITINKLGSASVIGHSLGGTMALWLASEAGSEFTKLIIVDALPATGALMIPDYKSENIVYDNPFNKQLLAMNEEAFDEMATQMASGMSLNIGKQQQIKNWILQADRETYVYGYTDLLKLDIRKDIAAIETLVVILAATHPFGEEMARKTYQEQYKELLNYDLKFAENAAHFIMYDRPQWFLDEIMAALK